MSAAPHVKVPAPRRRRLSKRKPMPNSRRELFIYAGTDLIGVVKITSNGSSKVTTAIAYDPDGKRVGIFTSLQAASDALYSRPEGVTLPRGSRP
jgi:hypothetical protein